MLTYTLCTIADTAASLSEMRRVLEPGGELYFSEHGLAPDEKVAKLQARITPCRKKIAGGCDLNRDIPTMLQDAPFELLEFYCSRDNSASAKFGPRAVRAGQSGRSMSSTGIEVPSSAKYFEPTTLRKM